MRIRNSLQVGFRRVTILCFVFLLVAAEEKEKTTVDNASSDSQHLAPYSLQGRMRNPYHPHRSFDLFVGSKRKVPNTSDPLHNR